MKNPIKTIRESFSANTATQSDPQDTTTQSVDPLIAIPSNIISGQMEDFDNLRKNLNRYAQADSVYASDERLYSAIELMAIMIEKSIGDVSIVSIRDDDNQLSPEEKGAIKEAMVFVKRLKLKKLFYRYTIDLWKYGDAVDLIRFDSTGITGLQPLPMTHVTAVDTKSQIKQAQGYNQPMIQNPQWYVVDEQMSDPNTSDQIYSKDRILHISFNPERNQIKDNLNRWTMGVWSTAPINSLFAILAWKKNLIRNDMIAGARALPREDHSLDLSQFSLDKFPGTIDQKKAASIQAAEQSIKLYAESIRRREADQGFIHGKSTVISYIQPNQSFRDPSGQLDQINQWIGGPSGTPSALMGGESKGFTSVVHASSFLALRAEIYAGVIQDKLEELMKRHVGIARPGIRRSVVDRLYIKNRLILDRDRAELARMLSVMADTNVFTPTDLRAVWGLDPMTTEQEKEIIEWKKKLAKADSAGTPTKPTDGVSSTAEDLLRKKSSSPTGDQESSGKRTNDQNQRGKDRGRKAV